MLEFISSHLLDCLWLALLLILTYYVYTVTYNLYFHPISHFPGPRLAAATHLYEAYFHLWKGGQYSSQILKLHQQYNSPIIRVNPTELHITDFNYFTEIFNFDAKFDKVVPRGLEKNFESLQNTVSFANHRQKRRPFDQYFGRAAILKLEPTIQHFVDTMCERLEDSKSTQKPLLLSHLYRFLTVDIVSEYALSQPYQFLNDPTSNQSFMDEMHSAFKFFNTLGRVSGVLNLMNFLDYIPQWMIPSGQASGYVNNWRKQLANRVDVIQQSEPIKSEVPPHRIMLKDYFNDSNVPDHEKTPEKLLNNALLFVTAGMETTAFALTTATFHLLENAEVLGKLKAELAESWDAEAARPPFTELEKLPLLTAVIKESLRLSIGVLGRLGRVNHQSSMRYDAWSIPPGTPISMSLRTILYDETIFPEPTSFQPERWLQGENSKDLDKWLVVFSRGARRCIGEQYVIKPD